MRLPISILTFCCLVILNATAAFAQADIQESEKAVVAFDIQLQKLRDNELVKSLDAEKAISELQEQSGMNEFDITKVARIYGAIGAPTNLAAFEGVEQGGDVPMNFFIRIQFTDEASAGEMLKQLEREGETVEKDGKTYIKPGNGAGPTNLLAHAVNATTVEIGTPTYVYLKTRRIFTQSLTKRWESLPNHAIRLAVDLDSARDFIDEAVAAAEENLPDEAGMFLDLVNKTSALHLSIDLDAKDLISLVATGIDEDGAAKLQNGLEAILGLAKFGAKQGVAQMAKESPELGRIARAILDALKTNKQDNDISIVIPRPEGFNEAVGIAIKQARGAAEKMRELNDFKQYALAVHNYHDTFRRFPISVDENSGQSEDLSWRVRVLPFMEEIRLYEELDLKQAWDGETNQPFADKMPKIYGAGGKNASVCWVIPERKPKGFANITDGTSNTIMLIQNPNPVPWMQPKDVTIMEAMEIVTGLMDGQELIVAFYDGSVHRVSNKVDEDTLRKLLDPADGEPVDFDF